MRLSRIEVCALASLGVPRVLAHDLDLVGPAVNAMLVFAPLVAWVGYAVWRRVGDPLRALLTVGAVYGVLLAITHQILWTRGAFDTPPRLGGTLAGRLSPTLEDLVPRGFAVGSSLVTGVLVGAVSGCSPGCCCGRGRVAAPDDRRRRERADADRDRTPWRRHRCGPVQS
ncbi:hypothetical protein [Nocardia rhizosphaerae]|uniref:RDD family protein n=1 Tax=Nocardia rhizosphaerae TaxID=1691571 RepID=A0ABV8L9D8_9NOCA